MLNEPGLLLQLLRYGQTHLSLGVGFKLLKFKPQRDQDLDPHYETVERVMLGRQREATVRKVKLHGDI